MFTSPRLVFRLLDETDETDEAVDAASGAGSDAQQGAAAAVEPELRRDLLRDLVEGTPA